MTQPRIEDVSGSVVLPLSEVAFFRREFRTLHNQTVNSSYDFIKRFRDRMGRVNDKRWRTALDAALVNPENASPAHQLGLTVARSMNANRAVKWSHFTGENARARVYTQMFPIWARDGERMGEIVFDGRNLTWLTSPHPTATRRLERSEHGILLYRLLRTVAWHRGSGGAEFVRTCADGTVEELLSEHFGPEGKKISTRLRAV